MRGKHLLGLWCGLLFLAATSVGAEEIGQVSTTFKFVGANDKIVIEAFDDPDINGATCYVSRAKTGGIKGTIGVAEDTSDASISCRQTGPITLPERVLSGKDDGRRSSRSQPLCCLKKCRWYASLTRSAPPLSISRTATGSSKARRKTPSPPLSCPRQFRGECRRSRVTEA